MAATVTSQASLKQPKLLSFSPKTLQNPHPNFICFLVLTPNCILVSNWEMGSPQKLQWLSPRRIRCLEFPKRGPTTPSLLLIITIASLTISASLWESGELGCLFEVYRNDELTVDELKRKNPRGVLISPGPGEPQDSGISLQAVLELGPIVPLFGVCMGLQCIGEAFGGKIVRSPYGVMHGKSSPVYYNEEEDDSLFAGLLNAFTVGRYHSLVIEKDSFPSEELDITARTEEGLIMAARHKKYRHLQGVQFHPESIIITSEGRTIVRNFVKLIEKRESESEN